MFVGQDLFFNASACFLHIFRYFVSTNRSSLQRVPAEVTLDINKIAESIRCPKNSNTKVKAKSTLEHPNLIRTFGGLAEHRMGLPPFGAVHSIAHPIVFLLVHREVLAV